MTTTSAIRAVFRGAIAPALASIILIGTGAADTSFPRVVKVFPAPPDAHLILLNGNGHISISAWDRREISVRADSTRSAVLEGRVSGSELVLHVRRERMERVNLEISAPTDTSLSIRNAVGEVDITGLRGHLKVESVDGDIHMVNVKSPSMDVRVIRGDIYFDGDIRGNGPYSLQSMKGDIDVSLPPGAAFDLAARALTDNINIGSYLLSPGKREPKSMTGKYEGGGPRLCLTTFDGQIFLHKK